MKITQTYPLPKKPMEYNNLIRLLNFDISNEGFYFIQTKKKDDVKNGIIRLWAYRQDVKDDRVNIFKKSETMKIKKKHEVIIPVRADLYKVFGVGTLSKDLSYAIILPDSPSKLPEGIRDDPLWYDLFSNLILKKNSEASITGHYEERLQKLDERQVRDETDKQEEKTMDKFKRILKSIGKPDEKEVEKSKPK